MPTELRNVMADVNSLDSFLRVVNAVKLRAVIDELRIHSRGNKGARKLSRRFLGWFINIAGYHLNLLSYPYVR